MSVADIKNYVTVTEAAKMLKRNERIVRRYIEKGYLRAERLGRAYLIDVEEIKRFEYPRPGNPLLTRRSISSGR
jgi:excisionase family DNA binding protein